MFDLVYNFGANDIKNSFMFDCDPEQSLLKLLVAKTDQMLFSRYFILGQRLEYPNCFFGIKYEWADLKVAQKIFPDIVDKFIIVTFLSEGVMGAVE